MDDDLSLFPLPYLFSLDVPFEYSHCNRGAFSSSPGELEAFSFVFQSQHLL